MSRGRAISVVDASREIPVQQLVEKCLGVMGGLHHADAAQHSAYFDQLKDNNFLDLLESVMRIYADRKAPMVMRASLEAIQSMQTINPECRAQVFDKCGAMVLHMLRTESKNTEMCLEILGALQQLFSNTAIKTKTASGPAIQSISGVLEANKDNHEVMSAALLTLGKFTADKLHKHFTEPDASGKESETALDYDFLHAVQVPPYQRQLVHKQAVSTVVRMAKEFKDDRTFLGEIMRFLASIFWDDSITNAAMLADLIDVMLMAFQHFSFDPTLRRPTLCMLLCLVMHTKQGTGAFVKRGGLSSLLQYMETCETKHLEFITPLLFEMLTGERAMVEPFLKMNGIDALIDVMSKNRTELGTISNILEIFLFLAADDEQSKFIGEHAMHVLAAIMEHNSSEKNLLVNILMLQEQLAFQEENILCIVQYGGIEGILNGMRENSEDEELTVRSLKLLENIFLGSKLYAAVAWELGCSEVIDDVASNFEDNETVEDCVRTTKLHLDISSRGKQDDIKREAERKEREEAKKAKKQRAKVGGAKQARMMKMMSLRSETGEDSSRASIMSDRGSLRPTERGSMRPSQEEALTGTGSSSSSRRLKAGEVQLRSGSAKMGRTAGSQRNLNMVEGGANPMLSPRGAPPQGKPTAAAIAAASGRAGDDDDGAAEEATGGEDADAAAETEGAEAPRRKQSRAEALKGKVSGSFKRMFGKKK